MELGEFIKVYGPFMGLAIIAVWNYLVTTRKTSDVENRQAEAITREFEVSAQYARRLQDRITLLDEQQEKMHAQLNAADAAYKTLESELRTTQRQAEITAQAHREAQSRADALAVEVRELRDKVTVMEAERAARAKELERETTLSKRLEGELKAAREEISKLQTRVAHLEGQNETLEKVIKQIRVVSVTAEPEAAVKPGGKVQITGAL